MKHRELQSAIDGNTKALGLVGQGIGYTLSPFIHNYAIERMAKNLIYLPFDISERSLNHFLEFFWDAGGIGFNVTTPHKGAVSKLITGHGLSSVNTVYRGEFGWEATSTDAVGFAAGLERLGKTLDVFTKIVILGSGGAVQALCDHFARRAIQANEITILARRPQSLTGSNSSVYQNVKIKTLSSEQLSSTLTGSDEYTLLIQATNAPLKGDDLSALVPALKNFKGTFVDLVYGQPSALYYECLNRGLPTQDGEPMLIEQARASQRLWLDQAVTYEEIADVLRSNRRMTMAQGT